MTILPKSLTTISQSELQNFARDLSMHLASGDVILLHGQIGAGKSVFARTIIQHLCPEETEIPSPTFTLIQTYDSQNFEIHHCDLYRLTSPEQCFELGLDHAFEHDVSLIEWPDRLGNITPDTALNVLLDVTGDDTRNLTIQYHHDRWDRIFGKNL